MKIFKLILPIALAFLLCLPCYGMHLPENKVIDRELTVEEDRSIIKDSLEKEDGKITNKTKTFVMSLPLYVKRVIVPFLMLFLLGPLVLLIEREIEIKRKKTQ